MMCRLRMRALMSPRIVLSWFPANKWKSCPCCQSGRPPITFLTQPRRSKLLEPLPEYLDIPRVRPGYARFQRAGSSRGYAEDQEDSTNPYAFSVQTSRVRTP